MKILIGVPLAGTISDAAFLSLWQIAQRGYPIVQRGYARTDIHRNEFVRALLASDYTHLCYLDADHVHPPDVVERLAGWAEADEQRFRVVSGLNFRRGPPYDPMAFMRSADGLYHSIAEWPAGLFRVDVVGAGTLLVHRSVFEELAWPWWAYEYDDGHYPTEDIFFCNKCREHGIDIWVDGTLTSPHLILDAVDGDIFKAWLEANPDKIMPQEVTL